MLTSYQIIYINLMECNISEPGLLPDIDQWNTPNPLIQEDAYCEFLVERLKNVEVECEISNTRAKLDIQDVLSDLPTANIEAELQ
jgi:hypothetical protein